MLYLAGHLAFRLRMTRTLAPKRTAAIAATAVAVLATSSAPSLLSLTLVTVLLTMLAASETAGRLRRQHGRST
jgi:hypothetical protein